MVSTQLIIPNYPVTLTVPLFNLIVVYSVGFRGYPDGRSIRRHHNEVNIKPFILYDFQTLVMTVRQDFICFSCINWLNVSNITKLKCLIEYFVVFKMLKVLYNPSTREPIVKVAFPSPPPPLHSAQDCGWGRYCEVVFFSLRA